MPIVKANFFPLYHHHVTAMFKNDHKWPWRWTLFWESLKPGRMDWLLVAAWDAWWLVRCVVRLPFFLEPKCLFYYHVNLTFFTKHYNLFVPSRQISLIYVSTRLWVFLHLRSLTDVFLRITVTAVGGEDPGERISEDFGIGSTQQGEGESCGSHQSLDWKGVLRTQRPNFALWQTNPIFIMFMNERNKRFKRL